MKRKFNLLRDKDAVLIKNEKNYIHSTTEPAYVFKDTKIWFKDGVIYRSNDKPPIQIGDKEYWYADGFIYDDFTEYMIDFSIGL